MDKILILHYKIELAKYVDNKITKINIHQIQDTLKLLKVLPTSNSSHYDVDIIGRDDHTLSWIHLLQLQL